MKNNRVNKEELSKAFHIYVKNKNISLRDAESIQGILKSLSAMMEDVVNTPNLSTHVRFGPALNSMALILEGIKAIDGVTSDISKEKALGLSRNLLVKLTKDVNRLAVELGQNPQFFKTVYSTDPQLVDSFHRNLEQAYRHASDLQRSLPKNHRDVFSIFSHSIASLFKSLARTLHLARRPPETFIEAVKQHKHKVEGMPSLIAQEPQMVRNRPKRK